MSYDYFIEKVIQSISERLGTEARVTVGRVLKNNQQRIDSLTILQKGENMAPAIYLNAYYSQYQRGVSFDSIIEQMLAYYYASARGSFDLSCFSQFEKIKEHIVCKLVNFARNQYILQQVPYHRFLDLAVVYYYRVDDPVIGKGSILIQNSHMKMWNTTLEEMHALAEENTKRLLPHRLMGIEEMIAQIVKADGEYWSREHAPLYVLTNTEQYFGAVNMIFSPVLEEIREKLQCDFYLLPSSIHECMVLPANDSQSPEELHWMVKMVNRECVEEAEILGESVYKYEMESRKLEQVYP